MPNAAAWADSLLDSWGSRGMGGCLGQTLSSTVRCGQKRDSDGPDSLGRFSPDPLAGVTAYLYRRPMRRWARESRQ